MTTAMDDAMEDDFLGDYPTLPLSPGQPLPPADTPDIDVGDDLPDEHTDDKDADEVDLDEDETVAEEDDDDDQ